MNRIDHHNYEAFPLDSIEGRLTAEQQLELDLFLALNPELVIDLEDLADTTFDPYQTFFPDKPSLKKTPSDLVPAEHFIAYIEQHLSAEEKSNLEKSCEANPVLARELELYQNTITMADANIVFEDKESLKRRSKVVLFTVRAASFAAAASVAFLIVLYMMWPAKTADVMSNSYAHAGERKSGAAKEVFANNNNNNDNNSQGNSKMRLNSPGQPASIQNSSKKENTLVQNKSNTPTTTTVLVSRPDTNSRMVAKNQEFLPEKEPVLMASASQKTVVEVIMEDDGEANEAVKKKPGFWALAGKTLKGLNKAGVKTVDGKEESTKEIESYALTLGGMSITHKSN